MIKTSKFYITTIVLVVLISSCSADEPSVTDPFVGSWELAEINMRDEIDVNGDSNFSINLLDELSCLNATLTIESNLTWTSMGNSFDFDDNGDIADTCTIEGENSGTWQVSSNGDIVIENSSFRLDENKLISERENDIIGIQSITYQKK